MAKKKSSSYEELKEQLMAENSKRNMNRIAGIIGNDDKLFKALLAIMMKDDDEVVRRRAAWAVTAVTDEYPELLPPRLAEICDFLKGNVHEAILRCLLRQFMLVDIPEELEGILFDLCFNWSENPKYALAVRANAMTVLYNISNSHIELKKELILLFEQITDEDAPAMKARSKILLHKLYRETKEFSL